MSTTSSVMPYSTSSTMSRTLSSPINLTHHITLKLTRQYYVSWKAQLLPYLYGQKLFGYVDGSIPAPPPLLPSSSFFNPDHDLWFEQDRLILNTLISSLSELILNHIVKYGSHRRKCFSRTLEPV